MDLAAIDFTRLIILIIAVAAVLLLLRVALRLTASLLRLGCLIGIFIVIAYIVVSVLQ